MKRWRSLSLYFSQKEHWNFTGFHDDKTNFSSVLIFLKTYVEDLSVVKQISPDLCLPWSCFLFLILFPLQFITMLFLHLSLYTLLSILNSFRVFSFYYLLFPLLVSLSFFLFPYLSLSLFTKLIFFLRHLSDFHSLRLLSFRSWLSSNFSSPALSQRLSLSVPSTLLLLTSFHRLSSILGQIAIGRPELESISILLPHPLSLPSHLIQAILYTVTYCSSFFVFLSFSVCLYNVWFYPSQSVFISLYFSSFSFQSFLCCLPLINFFCFPD